MPIRSPGPIRQVACWSSVRSPRARSTSSTSSTSLPSRWVANRCSSSRSRGGGTSSISALAASMRNFGFDVRAGGPRRSQASSLRTRFCRRTSDRGGLALPLCLGQHERRVAALVGVDDPVVHLPRLLADRVEEPPVVGDHDQRGRTVPRGASASHATASTSRWLVGSSRTIRSCSPRSRPASPQRRRSPPDSPATARSSSTPASSTSTISRSDGVGRPLVVGPAAEHHLAHRVGVGEVVGLAQVADRQPALPRHPAAVGLLLAGHDPQQGGLAVPVAADDADPLPGPDAEGDVGEQRADAVRLGDPLEVDQVSHTPPRGRRRPGRGRRRSGRSRDPRAGRRWRGRARRRARDSIVGPEPDSSAYDASHSSAASATAGGRAAGRTRRPRGRCGGTPGAARRRPGAQRLEHLAGGSGSRGRRPRAGRRRRRRTGVDRPSSLKMTTHHQVPLSSTGVDHLAATGARWRCRRPARTARRDRARAPARAARRRRCRGSRAGPERPAWRQRRPTRRPCRPRPGCSCAPRSSAARSSRRW